MYPGLRTTGMIPTIGNTDTTQAQVVQLQYKAVVVIYSLLKGEDEPFYQPQQGISGPSFSSQNPYKRNLDTADLSPHDNTSEAKKIYFARSNMVGVSSPRLMNIT